MPQVRERKERKKAFVEVERAFTLIVRDEDCFVNESLTKRVIVVADVIFTPRIRTL